MDVYRGDIKAERNFFRYALFISFFPQLVAGPIERSKHLLEQLKENHNFNYESFKNGICIMLWGYFCKMVISDRCALLVNEVFGNYENYEGVSIFIAVIFFSFQIYCDFMGYSLIAAGAAKIMGIDLMYNFKQPYFAVSIKEFWQRWHISLSSWFRDYLYIPLGGNRKGKLIKYRNILIVFLCSGLWHGASWAFFVWGGVHAVYQIIGDFTKNIRIQLQNRFHMRTDVFSFRLGQRLATFCMVSIAWIFFRAESARTAMIILKKMFISFNFEIFSGNRLYEIGLDKWNFTMLILGLLFLLLISVINERKKTEIWISVLGRQNIYFEYLCYWIMVIMIIFSTNLSTQEFIYFQF